MSATFHQVNEGSGDEFLTLQEAEGTFGVDTTSNYVHLPVTHIVHGLSDTSVAAFDAADWTTDQEQAVKASAGKLTKVVLYSTDDEVEGYVSFYNIAAGSVTVGTSTPTKTYKVPKGGVVVDLHLNPILFDTAITVGVATTYGGATAPADDKIVVEVEYI